MWSWIRKTVEIAMQDKLIFQKGRKNGTIEFLVPHENIKLTSIKKATIFTFGGTFLHGTFFNISL